MPRVAFITDTCSRHVTRAATSVEVSHEDVRGECTCVPYRGCDDRTPNQAPPPSWCGTWTPIL